MWRESVQEILNDTSKKTCVERLQMSGPLVQCVIPAYIHKQHHKYYDIMHSTVVAKCMQ